MDHLQARTYLLDKPFTIEDFPFGEDVAVFKVKGKMFATLARAVTKKGETENPDWWMNLKCDPNEALILRDMFDAVIPGYHMNKEHWNTVVLNGSIPSGEIERMIDNSFNLVVSKMTKKDRTAVELLG